MRTKNVVSKVHGDLTYLIVDVFAKRNEKISFKDIDPKLKEVIFAVELPVHDEKLVFSNNEIIFGGLNKESERVVFIVFK